jgi:hypothetical protein
LQSKECLVMCKRGDCADRGLHAPGLFLGPKEAAFASTAFDRNLTAIRCLSLSLPVCEGE